MGWRPRVRKVFKKIKKKGREGKVGLGRGREGRRKKRGERETETEREKERKERKFNLGRPL